MNARYTEKKNNNIRIQQETCIGLIRVELLEHMGNNNWKVKGNGVQCTDVHFKNELGGKW